MICRILQFIPGCAGGCRSCPDRRGNHLVLDRHNLLVVRSLREDHCRSSARSVHSVRSDRRTQPESHNLRDAVVARLPRVAIGRSRPGVAVHHRTAEAAARSSCYDSAVDHAARAGQIDLQIDKIRIGHLVGKMWEARCQCRFRLTLKTCIQSR